MDGIDGHVYGEEVGEVGGVGGLVHGAVGLQLDGRWAVVSSCASAGKWIEKGWFMRERQERYTIWVGREICPSSKKSKPQRFVTRCHLFTLFYSSTVLLLFYRSVGC